MRGEDDLYRKHFAADHPGVPYPAAEPAQYEEMVELLAEISLRIGEEVVSYQGMIDRLRARQVLAPYGEWELWEPSQATRLGLQSICEAQDIPVYFKTFSERDTVKLSWNDFIQWHDAFFCGMEEGIIVPCDEPLWCIFINDGCVEGYIIPSATDHL